MLYNFMNSFITKLNVTADLQQMTTALEEILKVCPWPERQLFNNQTYPANQLGITYRPGSTIPWIDAGGSLIDPKTGQVFGYESDFTELNPAVPNSLKDALARLSSAENTKFGRIRFMRLMPKTGLTVHADFETRYHYVIKTNPNSFFGEKTDENGLAAVCYHVPADGHFYHVDTTRPHFVYNGGWEPRIHLVICKV
jgi:hypothetical protein